MTSSKVPNSCNIFGMLADSGAYKTLYWSLSEIESYYHLCWAECRKKPRSKPVHDLRTSLRRLIALLDLAIELHPSKKIERLRKEFKDELDSLRDLRDFQWQEKALDDQLKPPELQSFRCSLKKKRRQEQKKVKQGFQKSELKQKTLNLQALSEDLLTRAVSPVSERRAKGVIEKSLERHYHQLENCAYQAKASIPPSLHVVRIQFKKFRYTWDGVVRLFPMQEKVESQLKAFQKLLGNIQDAAVLIDLIYEFIVKQGMTHPDQELLQFLRVIEKKQEEWISEFFEKRDSLLKQIRPVSLYPHRKAA